MTLSSVRYLGMGFTYRYCYCYSYHFIADFIGRIIETLRALPMKVVLFCGGLGMRIREYSEHIPKPMIPIASQPIVSHIMQYYSDYGHQDFILCLGHKASVIKDYFLNYKQTAYSDCIISDFGKKVEILGQLPPD